MHFPNIFRTTCDKLYVRSKKVRKAQNGTGMDFITMAQTSHAAGGKKFDVFGCLSVMLLICTLMGDSVPIKPFEFRNGFDVSR